ncbi:CoA transferase subunit A [Streptomyces iconiensis]|uniref:CoA-transferase n=1 Tax=Streptomyces iconiensis TaxID=1384038 RepID=A0ABT7A355_9ACTN|nr:CoA-transferase [Streptomyces iconiensis]MDJ1135504.1 CoA-transferase [Streptomyces iconiensis]
MAHDKTLTPDQFAARIESGMTLGIGGWGARRKPMALVRALLRTDVKDLTVVSPGGPDVGLLAAAGRVRKLIAPFVTLDSVPLEPHFRTARQGGAIEFEEWDEAMFLWGLTAAANRLPFMPIRAGLGSDVMTTNPRLRTVTSPYEDGEELLAAPALRFDAALVHMNRADRRGNAQCLGPDPYFDGLLSEAADRTYVSCEQLVDRFEGPPQSLVVQRQNVAGVVQAPNGAHFTSCVPDYERDEAFQRAYVKAAAEPEEWQAFERRFLSGDEDAYQRAVDTFREENQ